MNPASREAKRALIKLLNDATLDPNTGEQESSYYPQRNILDLTTQSQRSSSHPQPCT
jgi:hypothetical protein